jgi:23S rRNA (cytidine1920-2'-O)/16S rRNA (cytidine1409-2'-O)-methyltransferase
MCASCVIAITVRGPPNRPAVRFSAMTKVRLDTALTARGLFHSRSAAAASVRAGAVRVGADGPIALKPSQLVGDEDELIVKRQQRYVSRGGLKMENALEALDIVIADRSCLDVGASTGGFSDCLLQHGARRVAALDVGYGLLAAPLRGDPRVTVIERRNARHLTPEELPFAPDLVTIDVSFISLRKVLPAIASCLAPGGEVLALVKPQFELGRERVGKGGVVRSAADRRDAILAVAEAAGELGLPVRGLASSGLPGPKGNCETFVWCGGSGQEVADLTAAALEVDP